MTVEPLPSAEDLGAPQRLQAALESALSIYFNGFVNMAGIGDVVTVLERNGEPVAILNMSFTVAKTLSIALGMVIARLEEQSGREMLTTADIEKIFGAQGEKS